jgi:hypothetical protein
LLGRFVLGGPCQALDRLGLDADVADDLVGEPLRLNRAALQVEAPAVVLAKATRRSALPKSLCCLKARSIGSGAVSAIDSPLTLQHAPSVDH